MAKPASACPICRKPALRLKPAAADILQVTCRDCGQYLVSETFRQAVGKQSTAVRRNALEKARMRAGYGALPSITTYDLP